MHQFSVAVAVQLAARGLSMADPEQKFIYGEFLLPICTMKQP
jgi:hypothetical protein